MFENSSGDFRFRHSPTFFQNYTLTQKWNSI